MKRTKVHAIFVHVYTGNANPLNYNIMRKFFTSLLAVGFAINLSAQVVQTDSISRAADPNVEIGKALKNTGIISMSVGVPCVAAGVATLLYAEFMPNPTAGYTTSQAQASQHSDVQNMSTSEYIAKLEDYNGKKRAASNAGYILTGAGASLTIIGVPLFCYGKRIMTLNVNYTGNGAGLALNF